MLEWVPSAICFVFGHIWYVPDIYPASLLQPRPNLGYCRRCGEPTMDQRIIDAFNKSHAEWVAKGWVK